MRTIIDIYESYRIPPWLQEHQLRVAAVGKVIIERIEGADVSSVVSACLLHDMGNILKIDLTPAAVLASLIPVGERDYWLSVKKSFQEKYGTNELHATQEIIQELGISAGVRGLIQGMGFAKSAEILRGGNIELCVVEYADQRVGPYGVLSLEERIADGNRRYAGRYAQSTADEAERYHENLEALRSIEKELMRRANMDAKNITDDAILPVIEQLRGFSL